MSRFRLRRFFSDKALFAKDFRFRNAAEESIEKNLTPKKIFELLDKRVVGQAGAKRMLAIAYSKFG